MRYTYDRRDHLKRPLPTLAPVPDRSAPKTFIKLPEFIDRSLTSLWLLGADKLCLLIPAHNEELVLRYTITSAIRSGMPAKDIYVVDDNSTDTTAAIAKELLGEFNVLTVDRSGKGLAIQKAARAFRLSKRYNWIHIADADGSFDENYFETFRTGLQDQYAAATGYLKSSPGSLIGKYRVFEYTLGMEMTRRVQVAADVLQVIPGATSCIRADIFDQLDFNGGTPTEDYDVTLQIHRQNLGKIQFIPNAIAFTQDPQNFKDFVKQITRWYQGGVECMIKHRIGRQNRRLDYYIGFQIFQNMAFIALLFIVMPIIAILTNSLAPFASLFLWDFATMSLITLLIAARSGRWDILNALPLLYGLRWVNTYVFTKVLVRALIGQKRHKTSGTWQSVTRSAAG